MFDDQDVASVGDTPAVTLAFAASTSNNMFFNANDYQGILGVGPGAISPRAEHRLAR